MTDTKDLLEDPYEYQKLIGFEIVEWAQDFAKLHLPMAAKHGNRYGIPHGGVHATLARYLHGVRGLLHGRSRHTATRHDPIPDSANTCRAPGAKS